jgi:regulator of ribosome biosynthesis
MKFLVSLFECPTQPSDVGPVVQLPPERAKLPRSQRIPEPKPPTRWEKFAKEKGIQKKKRDRMLFDEDADEFRPRFGYKRAQGGLSDVPIVEVKPGDDPYADPWSEDRQLKRERVKKNEKNRSKNSVRQSGGKSVPRAFGTASSTTAPYH